MGRLLVVDVFQTSKKDYCVQFLDHFLARKYGKL